MGFFLRISGSDKKKYFISVAFILLQKSQFLTLNPPIFQNKYGSTSKASIQFLGNEGVSTPANHNNEIMKKKFQSSGKNRQNLRKRKKNCIIGTKHDNTAHIMFYIFFCCEMESSSLRARGRSQGGPVCWFYIDFCQFGFVCCLIY